MIRDVFAYLEEGGLPQAIDILYDRAFLQQQRKLADELGYEELTKEVIAFIDLTNLSTMARGIVQHQNSNFYQPCFLARQSLKERTVDLCGKVTCRIYSICQNNELRTTIRKDYQ